MLTTVRIVLAGMLISLLLGACSTSPPSRFYTLSALEPEAASSSGSAVLLGLGPLRMPEYLNRSQIVTRGSDAAILIDEFVRWSEPLALAMPRILAANVDNLLPDTGVVVFPYEPFIREQLDYRLVGDINRFDTDRQGRVVLDVQWAVSDRAGRLAVAVRRSRYEARAAPPGDTDAMIVAMNRTLADFSRDIASSLRALR